MPIIDGIGAVVILLGGAAIGMFLTSAYHEGIRNQRRAYEREMAEQRDFYAALAMLQRRKADRSAEDEEGAVQ